MEAVQWVYDKCVLLGFTTVSGRLEGNPDNKIYVYESDHALLSTKDGQYAEKPVITVSVIRQEMAQCYEVYNDLRSAITDDIINGIQSAMITSREIFEHEKKLLYRMDINIKIKQNI